MRPENFTIYPGIFSNLNFQPTMKDHVTYQNLRLSLIKRHRTRINLSSQCAKGKVARVQEVAEPQVLFCQVEFNEAEGGLIVRWNNLQFGNYLSLLW